MIIGASHPSGSNSLLISDNVFRSDGALDWIWRLAVNVNQFCAGVHLVTSIELVTLLALEFGGFSYYEVTASLAFMFGLHLVFNFGGFTCYWVGA